MSSYSVADFVNGRHLPSGTPVVGFLVSSQAKEYPLDTNPNRGAIRPADYFAPESFAIFGTAEDGGVMEVDDESSLAVRLALLLTGMPDWEELSKNALEHRRGVQLLGRPDVEGRPSNRRDYGLALMHRETYDFLVRSDRSELGDRYSSDGYRGLHRRQEDRTPDIEEVKSILNSCLCKAAALGEPGTDVESIVNHVVVMSDLGRICGLNADHDVREKVFPELTSPPRLLESLCTRDGKLVGDDLKTLLREHGALGNNLLKGGHSTVATAPDLDELLGLLWDSWHLRNRLYDVHAHFVPASYAGQDDNSPSILELGRVTMTGVWAELVDCVFAYRSSDESLDLMEAELARMDAMVANMRAHYEKVKSEDGES